MFTHLLSTIMLALILILSSKVLAIAFLILRHCTNSMDTATHSAFLAAVLLPKERTVGLGIVNVVKTASQGLGPVITGVLAGPQVIWVAFVIAGE